MQKYNLEDITAMISSEEPWSLWRCYSSYSAHHFGDQKCDVHMCIIMKNVCPRITQMVHMVQMVTLYSTMFSLPFLGIICSVKPKAETSNSKADTLSFKRILFFSVLVLWLTSWRAANFSWRTRREVLFSESCFCNLITSTLSLIMSL